MTASSRLVFTADLHWGSNARGDESTRALLAFLAAEPPDVLVLAGDIGAGAEFTECLALFHDLPCIKALVPGNHDIWTQPDDPRGDSLDVYEQHLPNISAAHGFHYLDRGPLFLPQGAPALVGTMNWYDYSWSIELLRGMLPDWENRLHNKTFSRGRHNDARFVRWPLTDERFTARVVEQFENHLKKALAEAEQAIVVTHHPAFHGIAFPRTGPPSVDALLWDAFAGNRRLEQILVQSAERISFTFSGHTHRARENSLKTIHGHNIGGDYHFKRLLMLEWPAGKIEAHVFGNPGLSV